MFLGEGVRVVNFRVIEETEKKVNVLMGFFGEYSIGVENKFRKFWEEFSGR